MSNQSVIKYNPCSKKVDLVKVKLQTVTLKQTEFSILVFEKPTSHLLKLLKS